MDYAASPHCYSNFATSAVHPRLMASTQSATVIGVEILMEEKGTWAGWESNS